MWLDPAGKGMLDREYSSPGSERWDSLSLLQEASLAPMVLGNFCLVSQFFLLRKAIEKIFGLQSGGPWTNQIMWNTFSVVSDRNTVLK